MTAKQTVEAMAKARFKGLRFFVCGEYFLPMNKEYVCIRLTVQDTHHYAADFFDSNGSDNREHMLRASMLLDRLERTIYKRHGLMIRCPVSRTRDSEGLYGRKDIRKTT
jgi:hypothetical protein